MNSRDMTPGDFANVCRQHDILDEKLAPEVFLAQLVHEHKWKLKA